MRTFTHRVLFTAILGTAILGLSGERVFAQDPPEVSRAKRAQRQKDEKRLKQNCGKKLKTYEYRRDEFLGAKNRGDGPDVLSARQKARDEALRELCKCVRPFYGAYGDLPPDFPPELVELCFPPGWDLSDPGPGVAPPAPPHPSDIGHPCNKAWDEYEHARAAGGRYEMSDALQDLCRCLKQHFGGVLPPEWVEFCKDPDDPRIVVVAPRKPKPPVTLPAEDGQPPGAGDSNPTDVPSPRAPRASTPGSEPRLLAEGECVEQRATYGRILAEFRRATGAERLRLRAPLATAYRDLCECLRITAPADYERFCRWSSGEPPDMPAEWGTVPLAPAPAPDAGASPPAGPGSPQPASGPLDIFFGDRTKQELKGSVTFKRHGADHVKHCNSCLEVRNGVSLSMERAPSPGGIRVTVIDPPVPTIDCQARADGGFDCGTVTANFCGMASQVSVPHLKLGQNNVEDLGLVFDFPGDALEICVHGRAMP